MRFEIEHLTRYDYSGPVRLGEHVLRLSPRPERISNLKHDIDVTPAPVWRQEETDAYGNRQLRLGFDGSTDHLEIVSRIDCDTSAAPPPEIDLPTLPWKDVTGAPPGFLSATPEDSDVQDTAKALARDKTATAFFETLTRFLYQRTDRLIRHDGAARSAIETLRSGQGACRDLTVLFMSLCRSLGVPARFVSGYQDQAESVDGRRHLHAWPEVWLPGIGWTGYDPTHGALIADTHLALAAGPDQSTTMPLDGGYWGDGVTSVLSYRLDIASA